MKLGNYCQLLDFQQIGFGMYDNYYPSVFLLFSLDHWKKNKKKKKTIGCKSRGGGRKKNVIQNGKETKAVFMFIWAYPVDQVKVLVCMKGCSRDGLLFLPKQIITI